MGMFDNAQRAERDENEQMRQDEEHQQYVEQQDEYKRWAVEVEAEKCYPAPPMPTLTRTNLYECGFNNDSPKGM